MRILMRNTIFKTGALAGLFSYLLALAVVFSGITVPAHALTAGEVQTEADLEQFVKAAVDEYYINSIIKNCDFSLITVDTPTPGTPVSDLIALQFQGDLQNFLNAPADQIRPLIALFPTLMLTRADIDQACNFDLPFHDVFGREDGDWKSGSSVFPAKHIMKG